MENGKRPPGRSEEAEEVDIQVVPLLVVSIKDLGLSTLGAGLLDIQSKALTVSHKRLHAIRMVDGECSWISRIFHDSPARSTGRH